MYTVYMYCTYAQLCVGSKRLNMQEINGCCVINCKELVRIGQKLDNHK